MWILENLEFSQAGVSDQILYKTLDGDSKNKKTLLLFFFKQETLKDQIPNHLSQV